MASRSRGSDPPDRDADPRRDGCAPSGVRASRSRRARRARPGAVTLALLLSGVGCVVGNPPWVAPSVRVIYRADGPGRAGLRFLVAREGNEIALTRGPADSAPVYDRRSGSVFFESREGGTWDLYRVGLSGEDRVAITRTPALSERWPVPSPDGRSLYFTSDVGGADQIYRSDPDGTSPVPVTRGPAPHSAASVDSAGSLVALEGEGESARLVRIDAATGIATALTGAGALPPVGRPFARSDGDVVYPCRGGGGGGDICLLPAGGRAVRLTSDSADDRSPAWSPDGRGIVFSSNRQDGNFEIYVMRADGSDARRLTKEKGSDGEPFWVP